MEMVPIRNRRRQPARGAEPLLSNDDLFQDEWLPPERRQQRFHRRRRRQQDPYMSNPSNSHYQAPLVTGVSVPSRQMQHRRQYNSDFQEGEVPYRDGSTYRKKHLIHHIHHNILKQTNPAQDLADDCISYGGLCFQCVRTQEIGLTENFGTFDMLLEPGLYVLCWPYSTIAARLSLRVQQMDIVCETKTIDHVFVHITVSIQYKVLPQMAYMAHYRVEDICVPIQAHVLHVVRSTVPTSMDLDRVFSSKHKIADAIADSLRLLLRHEFGYDLVHTLCTNVMPASAEVQRAMNEVEACRREKLATPHQAEANKVTMVKSAEAQAEAAYLNGLGTAKKRHCIAEGMQRSAIEWRDTAVAERKQTMQFSQVTQLLLVTQYMDLLGQLGANDLIIRPQPGEVVDMQKEGILTASSEGKTQFYDSSDDDSSSCPYPEADDDQMKESDTADLLVFYDKSKTLANAET